MFLLSLGGNIITTKDVANLRLFEDKIIISNEYSKIMELGFEKCYYYGDDGAQGFVQKVDLDEEIYMCYDYIAFNSGGKHEIDFIHTGDDFVSEIWFYSSDRIDGNTPVRDACAVSKLTESQLRDFDYSETMTRFKVLKIMKDNGMRGKQNGYTKKGTPRHYDFRTTSIRRETSIIENEYKSSTDSVEIKETCEKVLLQSLPDAIAPYDRLLGMLDENSP